MYIYMYMCVCVYSVHTHTHTHTHTHLYTFIYTRCAKACMCAQGTPLCCNIRNHSSCLFEASMYIQTTDLWNTLIR